MRQLEINDVNGEPPFHDNILNYASLTRAEFDKVEKENERAAMLHSAKVNYNTNMDIVNQMFGVRDAAGNQDDEFE